MSDKTNVGAHAFSRGKSARLEVVRPIKPGEEIFVSYGRDYWRKADAPHFTVDVPDWEWDLSDPFAVPSAPAPIPVTAVSTTAAAPSPVVPAPAVPQPAPVPRRGPAVCPDSPTFCRCSDCTPVVPDVGAVITPVRPSLPVVVEHLAECLGSPLDPSWHLAFEPLILAPSAHLCKNPDISDNIDSP